MMPAAILLWFFHSLGMFFFVQLFKSPYGKLAVDGWQLTVDGRKLL